MDRDDVKIVACIGALGSAAALVGMAMMRVHVVQTGAVSELPLWWIALTCGVGAVAGAVAAVVVFNLIDWVCDTFMDWVQAFVELLERRRDLRREKVERIKCKLDKGYALEKRLEDTK